MYMTSEHIAGNLIHAGAVSRTRYDVECWDHWIRDRKGNLLRRRKIPKLKWQESFWNIVVTTGLNKLLDATFKTGLTTPAWFVALKGTGTMLAADTMASHAGWAELVPYSDTERPDFTPGTISAGAVDNTAAKAVFNINGSSTIYGCFLTDSDTKSGTTGILYGGGDFGASRAVINGDTLNISITLTQASA